MIHDATTARWLEHLPLPAGVIRGGRFTYVNEALAAVVGLTREGMTGMEFFAPVAEEDRARVRARHLSRLGGSLEEVVRGAIATALATTKGQVAVRIEVDARVPAVPLDARLLRQAFLNVALNALQSMEGSGTLGVRISCLDLAGASHARVEMTDSGPGIGAEALPRVFEPFFTTRPKGTGLGLAVVKRIVEGNRGRVSVSSEPGEATAFVIDLPAEREA